MLLQPPDCPFCEQPNKPIEVSDVSYTLWNSGKGGLVQEAFPELTAEQREIILTGLHNECWPEEL